MLPKQPDWLNPKAKNRTEIRYTLGLACIIGICSGVAALILKSGINGVGAFRLELAQAIGAVWVLPLGGLICGIISGWLIEQFAPEAAGSGIPHVKAILARFPIALTWRIALVKIITTILVLGSGITLGRRGPTVHIGAALAAELSRILPTSGDQRRQIIAAGSAAGLAAGFNTPIAGVLFVIEELMRDLSSLTLETAILASFTGAVVSRIFGAELNLPQGKSIFLSHSGSWYQSLFWYVILGILAGILGSIFNRLIIFTIGLYRRLKLAMPWRMGLAGLISGGIVAALPSFFQNNAGLREFLITGTDVWQTHALVMAAHFFLTIIAYSAGAPGGLFAPALVLGSSLGFLVGTLGNNFFSIDSPQIYGLAGMGAFFTAVVKVPVTAIVIVFELTADFNLVLPLMISCAVAYLVGESIYSGSIYQHLLKINGILLKDEPLNNDLLTKLTAVEVMQERVETLEQDLAIEKAMAQMSASHHRGFPAIDDNGILVGIVTLSDLSKRTSQTKTLKEIMTHNPITVQKKASLGDVLYLLDRYRLSRLPVTEDNRLVGIITRSDIIQAEAKVLAVGKTEGKPPYSYIIYQTRAPATGKGRILLPIANPEHVSELFQIAVAIALYYQYELECLQVIVVGKHEVPQQTKVDSSQQRKIIQRLERLARRQGVLLHTQIRVATDVSAAILETIQERHINLMLMGWKGNSNQPEQIFGSIVDTLIQKAPCELIMVKLGEVEEAYPRNLEADSHWIIPVAGGPNAQKAMELIPALMSLYKFSAKPQIWLAQVDKTTAPLSNYQYLQQIAKLLRNRLGISVMALPIAGDSVANAIIELVEAKPTALVMLGASGQGLLEQTIYGNIPELIARRVNTTAIVVRNIL